MVKLYCRGKDGIALVYDITNRASFLQIQGWVDDIKDDAKEDITYVLLGNKCDLEDERQVTFEEGSELAATIGIPFFETSAKDGINTREAFLNLALKIVKKTDPEWFVDELGDIWKKPSPCGKKDDEYNYISVFY